MGVLELQRVSRRFNEYNYCFTHSGSLWFEIGRAPPRDNVVKPVAIGDERNMHLRCRDDMTGVTELLVAPPSDEVRDGPYVYPAGPYPHIQADKGKPESMMWAVERPDGGRGVGFTG